MSTSAAARPIVPEDSALVARLHEISAKKPKLIKSSLYDAPADPQIKVRSWKMDEFRYYDVPSPFPTLARGIFTVELPKEKAYRIVARGYDKFFNIGEVPWTTWDALEAHTAGPYTLSLKSNGCIIFIAALTPEKLLITSKHSIGPLAGQDLSHAEVGEQWIHRYLKQKGKTEADLAGKLWENNWTAIAELCDDSFEEHVLAYPPDKTGLHLHGLNITTKDFCTLPQETVDEFAAEWGFIRTASIELLSIAEVRKFTDEVGKTGAWNGEAIEGFVVRTHIASTPGKAPYAPGSTFFFKVKYDEPYLMYRDWREITKALLRHHEDAKKGKGIGMSENALPKGRMRRPETKVYVRWAIADISRNFAPWAEYTKSKGIVATRERFLTWFKSPEGVALLEAAKANNLPPAAPIIRQDVQAPFGKTIIVPVAIPGCGKTAVSVALAHIFGFGHTQSDDVKAKRAAPIFIKNVTNLLKTHDVVIADKNNHLKQHRAALRFTGYNPRIRLLALNWSLENTTHADVHRLCGSRIAARGANHQSLRPSEDMGHEKVIWMFINQTEPLVPDEVDDIVDMSLEDDFESAVQRAVSGVVRVLGLPVPDADKIAEGVAKARGYSVGGGATTAKDKGKEKEKNPQPPAQTKDQLAQKKGKPPRYYGLLPEVDLTGLLAGAVEKEPSAAAFYGHLVKEKRVATRPHVTLVHSKALQEPGAKELWERCAALNPSPAFTCKLGHLVWNDRVMVVTVDDVMVEKEASTGQVGAEFVTRLPQEVRDRLHVTVGTRTSSIMPVEGKALVEAWRAGKTNGVKSIALEGRLRCHFCNRQPMRTRQPKVNSPPFCPMLRVLAAAHGS
ncbi:tRNA ligase [Mycena indigotica]|uniref:tRNA ligase n=1 Tax=Mycena indigotica TaxID=2126181 RepID=A0A8H6TID6_9AGAR|nr:tRNA ligase [Mycena indigotica]KAF7316285.1 tRNA ligase [Mycena indigotica]